MNAHTGEIAAMISLPDFDPNDRPRPLIEGDAGDSPLFNRAVQGVYELGSALKIFTVAQALEEGLVSPDTMIDTSGPLTWGRFRIRDFRNYGPGAVRHEGHREVVQHRHRPHRDADRRRAAAGVPKKIGFFDPTPVELVEAPGAAPLLPARWSEISTMTVSYGHGISISPLHLATATRAC